MGLISESARGCELEFILVGDALGIALLIFSGEIACWSQFVSHHGLFDNGIVRVKVSSKLD